jgi:hypothetical protein
LHPELVAQVCAGPFFFGTWRKDPEKEFAMIEGQTCPFSLLANPHGYLETFFLQVSKEPLVLAGSLAAWDRRNGLQP